MEAVSRFSYDPLLVPKLLHTEEYARDLFEGQFPPLDDIEIEHHVDARLSRQKLLSKSPLVQFSFIIGEAALIDPVGGPATMRGQLPHLERQGSLRNVEIQVVPVSRGVHPGLAERAGVGGADPAVGRGAMNTTGLSWFKSSYSGGSGGNCLEVAAAPTRVHVRDSKDTAIPGLTVAPDAWTSFVQFARHPRHR